jgi:hypothetical protein
MANPQDDIDKLMSEIESLQSTMAAPAPVASVAPPVVAAQPVAQAVVAPPTSPVAVVTPSVEVATPVMGSATSQEVLSVTPAEKTPAELSEMEADDIIAAANAALAKFQEEEKIESVAEAAPLLQVVPQVVDEELVEELVQEDHHELEASIEETLVGLKEEESNVTPIAVKKQTDFEEESTASEEGCLSMTLSGQMTLKLKYSFEGQEVSIRFVDHCLKIELKDGTEFKVPIQRKSA